MWVDEPLSATNCPYRVGLLKLISMTAIKFHMKSWTTGVSHYFPHRMKGNRAIFSNSRRRMSLLNLSVTLCSWRTHTNPLQIYNFAVRSDHFWKLIFICVLIVKNKEIISNRPVIKKNIKWDFSKISIRRDVNRLMLGSHQMLSERFARVYYIQSQSKDANIDANLWQAIQISSTQVENFDSSEKFAQRAYWDLLFDGSGPAKTLSVAWRFFTSPTQK